MSNFHIEFPEFPESDSAAQALTQTGWEDKSWHNDSCPRFQKGYVTFWVDYEDHNLRDVKNSPRFNVLFDEALPYDGDTQYVLVYSGDNFAEALSLAEHHAKRKTREQALWLIALDWSEERHGEWKAEEKLIEWIKQEMNP